MRRIKIIFLLASLAAFSISAGNTHAYMTYTEQSDFMSATSGFSPVQTADFDDLDAGAIIVTGDSVDGITFTYDFGGVQMMVSDLWDTTSPSNFLGTDDGDIFQGGDGFVLSFASSNAVGMYFITADEPGVR